MARQIILVKQVNIHMYSIKVRYVSLMSIVNLCMPEFTAHSKAVPFCYLCFMLVFAIPSCLFLAALWSPVGRGWPLLCGVFLYFVAFPCGVQGREWCFVVLIPGLPSSLL